MVQKPWKIVGKSMIIKHEDVPDVCAVFFVVVISEVTPVLLNNKIEKSLKNANISQCVASALT